MKMKAMSKRSIHLGTPPVSKPFKAGKGNIWAIYTISNKKTAKKLKNTEKNAERYSIKQS